jgi:hypothetical protein
MHMGEVGQDDVDERHTETVQMHMGEVGQDDVDERQTVAVCRDRCD